MSKENTALKILLSEKAETAPSVPEDLVRAVLGIEERVQFDADRREAVQKISQAVQASLNRESLGGSADEHES